MTRSLVLLLGISTLLAGCASYHPNPLPKGPDLAGKAADLKTPSAPLRIPGLPDHHTLDPADGLDRTETVLAAVLNNPDLRAARSKRGIERAQLLQAGLLPDPQLSGSLDHPTSNGPGLVNGFSLGLAQDLQALITRGAARQARKQKVRKVDLNLLWQEWQVAERARSLFIEHRAQQRLQALYTRMRRLYARRYRSDKAALRRGDLTLPASAGDLSNLVDARSRLRKLARARNKTDHELRALLGLRPDAPLHLVGKAPVRPLDAAALHRATVALPHRRPDLLALRAGYASQEASVRQAILAQFPGIQVGINRAADTSAVQTVGLTLAIRLPLFNRNRGHIAVERATRAHLRRTYQARLDQAVGKAHRVWQKSRLLARQLREVRERVPELAAMTRRVRRGFQAGDVSAATWTDLQSKLLAKRAEAVQLRASLGQARVALDTLLGMPLEPAKPSRHGGEQSG